MCRSLAVNAICLQSTQTGALKEVFHSKKPFGVMRSNYTTCSTQSILWEERTREVTKLVNHGMPSGRAQAGD